VALQARDIDVSVEFDRAKALRFMSQHGEKAHRRRVRTLLFLARALAPVKTGRLRSSHEIRRRRLDSLNAESAVVATAPYASFVHDGRHPYGPMKKQPWMRRALDELRSDPLG
jgi:hypothetical protein